MRYKLIKEYPGSPKLGTIVENKNGSLYFPETNSVESSSKGNLFKEIVINNPEFWQEVVEKDYEVLEYINTYNKEIYIFNKNMNHYEPKIQNNNNLLYSRKKSFVEKFYKIHSVKRISDSEIFTIGDKTNSGTIKQIQWDNIKGLWIDFDGHGGYSSYKLLQKLKQPLFTTEDGVDIFEGDAFHIVDKGALYLVKTSTDGPYKTIVENQNKKKFGFFKDIKKAEEYILMNESKYSINDILSSLPNRKCEKYTSIKQMIENLKNM